MKKKKHLKKWVALDPRGKKLPPIVITGERPVNYVELDLDINDEAYAVLAQAGWETIRNDKQALASYAIAEALKEFVKSEKEKDARHIA